MTSLSHHQHLGILPGNSQIQTDTALDGETACTACDYTCCLDGILVHLCTFVLIRKSFDTLCAFWQPESEDGIRDGDCLKLAS